MYERLRFSNVHQWGYGATVARSTPDHKVGSSNLSALMLLYASHRIVEALVTTKRDVFKIECLDQEAELSVADE